MEVILQDEIRMLLFISALLALLASLWCGTNILDGWVVTP
jgi:hypothetical protein